MECMSVAFNRKALLNPKWTGRIGFSCHSRNLDLRIRKIQMQSKVNAMFCDL